MDTKIINHRYGKKLLTGLLFIIGPVFLLTTDPNALPLPLLVVPFIWLFSSLFVASWMLLSRKDNISRRQVALVAGIIASVPVLLAVFQSIHQLSIRDVLLSVGLVVLAAVYMLRADFMR
jgi:hypothetical protein